MKTTKDLMLIALILSLIIGGPFAVLWSLETLFAMRFSYDWREWLAVMVLTFIVSGNGRRK